MRKLDKERQTEHEAKKAEYKRNQDALAEDNIFLERKLEQEQKNTRELKVS